MYEAQFSFANSDKVCKCMMTSVFKICSDFKSCVVYSSLKLASEGGTADWVYRQWFLEVFLSPFSNVNDRIMPMSDAVSSEGMKTTGIQQRYSALSLTHRDFSSFSESFDDVMHCRLWDLQSLCNLTLRNAFFKYSTIFLITLSQTGEPLPIFISERLCLCKTSLL